MDECGRYFIDRAKQKGWQVEVNEQAVAGNPVSITINPEAKGAPVILSGHIDTVHPAGLFGYPCVRIEGNKIYGPGVADCKGGAVAGFMAMDALERAGFKDRPVTLVLQTDEETGSRQSKKKTVEYMCAKAKGAVAFLNLEGMGRTKEGASRITVARKGIERLLIKVYGKEAHASNCAIDGANAIVQASRMIVELDKLKDHDGVTCNIGTIKGGSVSNTVAGYCEFEIDTRYSTFQQREELLAYVNKVVNTTFVEGTTATVEVASQRIAMELKEANILLAEKINKIICKHGIAPLQTGKEGGGSDAAYITDAGVPCVDSVGVTGGDCHSVKEYAYVDSLLKSAKIQALTCAFIEE